jgi:DNA recombination-dependent growth factor C
VVNDEVKDRAEAMEAQQGYAPGRKQLKELRERVTEELMPRAFTRRAPRSSGSIRKTAGSASMPPARARPRK